MTPALPGVEDAPYLRGISRQLATGVCVLTAAHRGLVHGSTVSTASVIAQSPLTVCVSLRQGSFLATLAVESRRLACNVLSSRQALIADWFANPDRPPGPRQFELIAWDPAPDSGIPLLRGALAHLVCRVMQSIAVSDRDMLVLAEVTGGASGAGRPLLSFNAQLHDAELHGVDRRQGGRDAETIPVSGLH